MDEKITNYLNLTNGLEYINEIPNYKLVRIQSTYCEQKLFGRMIQDLDYNFLFDIAQGNIVRIYDTSSNKKQSRALYQGIEFIKYTLNRRWLNKNVSAYVKGMNVTDYFNVKYNSLNTTAKKKLDYVKKFLNTDKINIEKYCKKSLHDGEWKYFKNLLNEEKNNEQ